MSAFVLATKACTSARSCAGTWNVSSVAFRWPRNQMAEKRLPIGVADPHPLVRELHVTTRVIHRAAGIRTEKIDEQLPLPRDTVVATVLSEAAEQRILHEARQ
jgi:hypothetical protein